MEAEAAAASSAAAAAFSAAAPSSPTSSSSSALQTGGGRGAVFPSAGRAPRTLSPDLVSYFIRHHDDARTVSYSGHAAHAEDCGVARAHEPLGAFLSGAAADAVAYFEVRVADAVAVDG
jgi:hypothetical protein